MIRRIKVAKVHHIKPGQSRFVQVDGHAVALFNIDGIYFGLDNTCSHSRGPLSEGRLSGNKITCPWHGAQFEVPTGKCLAGPATEDVKTYSVHVENDSIFIEVP